MIPPLYNICILRISSWNNGRFTNSHIISTQEFLNDSPTVSQQTGYVSQEGGTGVTTGLTKDYKILIYERILLC